MEVNLKMFGARELEELMVKSLPAMVARRTLLAGMRKAAEPTLNYAKAKVPSPSNKGSSGALRQSLGMITVGQNKSENQFGSKPVAHIRMGPLSGAGARSMSAYAMYVSHYRGGKISLKKGAPIGQIRHGHLVEWGFKMRDGRQYPARPFMGPAAQIGIPIFVSTLVRQTKKKVEAAIKRHNAKSPVKGAMR